MNIGREIKMIVIEPISAESQTDETKKPVDPQPALVEAESLALA